MEKKTAERLLSEALNARKKAYAPYSHFAVGAALLAESGACYIGANIENASYTPTVCAERTAFFQAILNGERRFRAIAIVGGKADAPIDSFCTPCGVCRQVMSEFCDGAFEVILFDGTNTRIFTLDALFPERFSLSENEQSEDLL